MIGGEQDGSSDVAVYDGLRRPCVSWKSLDWGYLQCKHQNLLTQFIQFKWSKSKPFQRRHVHPVSSQHISLQRSSLMASCQDRCKWSKLRSTAGTHWYGCIIMHWITTKSSKTAGCIHNHHQVSTRDVKTRRQDASSAEKGSPKGNSSGFQTRCACWRQQRHGRDGILLHMITISNSVSAPCEP